MKRKNMIIVLVVIALVLVFDMLSKSFFDGKQINVLTNVFSFTSAHNEGAAWSLFDGKVNMLIVVTLLFLVAFTIFHLSSVKNNTMLGSVAFALIFGGALGNFIDRIIFGYVRDFIYVELINFPVFNIADSCLTVGVVLFAINIIFFVKTKNTKEKVNYGK